MTYELFDQVLHTGRPIHLVGIGGISMRALAEMLVHLGAKVQGSDRMDSKAVAHLRETGIPVQVGHFAETVQGVALVIRTAAVPDTNPEIAAAQQAGIPVISRAEAWGLIMSRYPHAVCVAGTHGKTSTTSMIATFAMEAGLDPTVMVGGELASIGGTLRIGHSDLFVAESCEYQNSFLQFAPTVGVILNVEMDHPDFFADLEDVIRSFRQFADLVPESGVLVVNGDDANSRRVTEGTSKRVLYFGMGEDCNVRAVNARLEHGLYHFDVEYNGEHYCSVQLRVPGKHNLYNALATAAVAVFLGVPGEDFAQGVEAYTGVGRRFEFKRTWRGAAVYDDYAHHPSEITVSLQAAKALAQGRVVCVFQPHTYSRTAALMPEFAQALCHADRCVLCPIYAARETDTLGVSSAQLAALIPGAEAADSLEDAAKRLEHLVQPGDLVFTMGAGDVVKIAGMLEE